MSETISEGGEAAPQDAGVAFDLDSGFDAEPAYNDAEVAQGEQEIRDQVAGLQDELGLIDADTVLARARDAYPAIVEYFGGDEAQAAEVTDELIKLVAEQVAGDQRGASMADQLLGVESVRHGNFDRAAVLARADELLPQLLHGDVPPATAARAALSAAAAEMSKADGPPSAMQLARYYGGQATLIREHGQAAAAAGQDTSARGIAAKYAARASQLRSRS